MKKIYLLLMGLLCLATVTTFAQTNYYSKAAATDFNDVNSWGTAIDGTGTTPASISNADYFTVSNSSAMSLSAPAAVGKLTVSSGSLTVATNTLTVALSTGNNSTLLISGGTLTVSTGNIVLNGNFSMTSGALNQTGGSITVDGNDNNNAGSSVASGTPIFGLTGGTPNCSAGTITIVDPHVNTYTAGSGTNRSVVISLSASTAYFTGSHTFVFGDGVSTTPGNADGFVLETYASGYAPVQNVTVNGSGANRWLTASNNNSTIYGCHIKGNLTINANSEFRQNYTSGLLAIGGNIVNNGTMTVQGSSATSALVLGTNSAFTISAAQTVSGSGVFQNLTATPTGNFSCLTINNTGGVTFSGGTSNIASQPANSLSVSNTLTLTAGKVFMSGAGSFVLGNSLPSAGTLAYTAGGFTSGITFGRWSTAATTGSTITAGADPTTATSRFPFVTAAGAGRSAWIQRVTPSAAGVIAITYIESAGTTPVSITDGAYNVNTRSNDNWSVSVLSGTAAAASYTLAIVAPGVYGIAPPDASTRIVRASDVIGNYQAGTATPGGQRAGLTPANLANTYYLGINVPACIAPGTLTAGSITSSSASISFAGTGSSFILEYGAPGFTPGTNASAGAGGTIVTGSSSPIALSGLSGNTSYDVYVRQDCTGSANGYSANSTKITFTTLCNPTAVPYSEGFEGIAANNTLPACMAASDLANKCKTYTASATGTNSALFAHSGSKFAAVYWSPSGTAGWFFSAPLNLNAGISYRASIWYNTDATAWTDAGLYYGTSATGASMTNTIVSVNNPLTNGVYNQMTGDFTPAVTGVYYIGIRGYNATISPNYIAFDDLNVDLTPACAPPTGVSAASITSTSATISFTGAGTNYIVEYGAPGFTPGTGATAGVGGTVVTGVSPVALSGLTPNTHYDVYVRQDCTGSGNGYSANTSVLPVYTGSCIPSSTGTGTYINNFSTTGAATNISKLNSGFAPGGYGDYYNSDVVVAPATTSFTVNFSVVGGTAGVNIWIDLNHNLVFETSERVYTSNAFLSTGDYSTTVTIPAGTTPGDYRMRIRTDFNSSNPDPCTNAGSRTEGEDYKVTVTAPPACQSPTALAVSSITANSATVSWTGSGTYILEYGLAGFTPGTGATPGTGGTIVTGASPQSLTGLTATTAYDVYIRQDCTGAANGYSANSFISFSTLPANDDCSGAIAIPCGGTVTGNTNGATNDALPAVTCGATGTTGNNRGVWFTVTPTIAGPTTIATCGSSFDTYLRVYAGTCGAFTSCMGYDDDGCSPQSRITFTAVANTTYYILMGGYGAGDHGAYTISSTCPALCNAPTAVSAGTITTTSANISFTGSAGNYIVEYGPAGFIPGTGATAGAGTVVTGTTSPIAISGLTASTAYDVYVRQDCSGAGNGYSANSTVAHFTTSALPPVNDDAPGAIQLTVNGGCTGSPYTNVAATASAGEKYPSCSGTIGTPVWFKFTATSTAVKVSTDIAPLGTFTDSKIALFSTTDPNDYSQFTIISCDDDGGNVGSGYMSVLYAANLTIGNTYYIAVDKYTAGTTAGTFCITVDDLNTSMLSVTNNCSSTYQTPASNGVTDYTGWTPLMDASGKLLALVRKPSGTDPTSFSAEQNINTGGVRQAGGVYYLDRNYRISSTETNVDVQFFFLASEMAALNAVDPGATLATLGGVKQNDLGSCQPDFDPAYAPYTQFTQNNSGTSNAVDWITTNVPSFSNFYLINGAAVVPVSIEYFTGSKQSSNNFLNWKVNCTSAPSVTLVLERSADGHTFHAINSIAATATRCLQDFNYTDVAPPAGISYYRLKVITPDGGSRYSNIVALINKDKGFELISVTPNPVKTATVLSISSVKAGMMGITVTDALGKLVMKQRVNVTAGNTTVNLDFSMLGAGTYQISAVNSDAERKSIRFVKF